MTTRVLVALSCAALASVAAAQSPAPSVAPSPAPQATPAPTPAPTPVPLPYTPASPDPRRGAELLKKAVAAHGGATAIDAVERLELRGFSGRILPGQAPIEMSSKTQMIIPGLYRHELVTQAGPIATLLNRDGAYVLLSGGALPLPGPEAGALRATANRNLAVLLRTRDAKEYRVARVGSGRLPEGEVEMVEYELAGQKTVLAIDPKTGLIRQSIYSMPMPTGTAQVIATYSDYRPLSNGVKYPFQSQGTLDGKPAFTSRLETVVVNGPLEPSLFVAPAGEPPSLPEGAGFPPPSPPAAATPSPAASPQPR